MPTPRPGPGRLLVRVRAAGLNGADMMQRRGPLPGPARRAAGHPGARARRRSRGARARRDAIRRGRPGDGDRRGRRSGRARGRPRARPDARPRRARLAGGGRVSGGVHDRARRALQPGRAPARGAPARARRGRRGRDGSGSARPGRRRGCRRHRQERGAPRGGRGARRARDRPGGLRGARPVRRRARARRGAEPRRQRHVARDRRPDRRHRRGGRREGGAQPARPDGKPRPDHGVHLARASARGEGAHCTQGREARAAAGRVGGGEGARRGDVRRSTTPRPRTSVSRRGASWERSS